MCIGDAFFDITVLPGMRKKLVRGGTVAASPMNCRPGGVGNVAFTMTLLGGTSAFCGCVGRDVLGEAYHRDLERSGVIPALSYSTLPTGILFSFLSRDGERSFLVSRGANDMLERTHVERAIANTRPRVIYISGHSLSDKDSIEAIDHAFECAHDRSIKIIFDCTPFNKISARKQMFREFTGKSHCVCLNMKEAYALTGKKDPLTIVRDLAAETEFIALKLGQDGCMLSRGREFVNLKAPKVRVLDSTGAGDAFAAAIALGISHDLPLRTIAKLALRISAIKVQNPGPRVPSMPVNSTVIAR